MNLICSHCGSDNLVGELKYHILGNVTIKIVCCDCGKEFAAPLDTTLHTKLECPFKEVERRDNTIEKMVKVSYKDTSTGEHATLISREENGMHKLRYYHDEGLMQMG